MEYLSQQHYQLLLNKEWLVKIDSDKSTPYLLKFYSSSVNFDCCLLITDTRNVWGEVLSSKQIARRWRDCNPQQSLSLEASKEEDEWRRALLELLSACHTLGGIVDLSFEVVDSHYADFAFELGGDAFKWRWETYSLGPKASAEIISKHLIMPLISVTHLTFSSADPVSELSEVDLEQAVDKVGRIARRTVDTHVKHAISRPRVATTLRRMTAAFNATPDLPPIISDMVKPDLVLPFMHSKSRVSSKHVAGPSTSPSLSPGPTSNDRGKGVTSVGGLESSLAVPLIETAADEVAADGSVTESEDEDHPALPSKSRRNAHSDTYSPLLKSLSPSQSGSQARVSPKPTRQPSPERSSTPNRTAVQGPMTSSSSPLPPAKRTKRPAVASSEDDDSEAERRKRVAQLKSSTNRGAKQPLKRGGRRF